MNLYLKACPFCGHSNIQTEACEVLDRAAALDYECHGWYAVCVGCNAQGPLRSTPERAGAGR